MNLFLNGNIIRQLNNIFKLSFKNKYRKDIKERLLLFVNRIYGDISLKDLKLFKEEIVLKDFEINELKSEFFEKYKIELLNFFNPIWFNDKETYIPTLKDREHFSACFLMEIFNKVSIDLKQNNEFVKEAFNTFDYHSYIERLISFKIKNNFVENKVFIKRKVDLKQLRPLIIGFFETAKEELKDCDINRYIQVNLKEDAFLSSSVINNVMDATLLYDCVLCARILNEIDNYEF